MVDPGKTQSHPHLTPSPIRRRRRVRRPELRCRTESERVLTLVFAWS
jgi:hypothetical protein